MIGEEIRAGVFRDTKNYYEQVPADMVARQLLTFAKKHAGKEVLDLGCATGNYSLALASMGYSVKGADVNPRYVELARGRGVDAYLVQGPLPFADRSFDTVLLFEVLEHLPDPVAALEHWSSRLRVGGVLMLYLPHPDQKYWRPSNCKKHKHIFWPKDTAEMLKDIGFVNVLHSERDLAWGFACVGFKA